MVKKDQKFNINVEEMARAGLHFGHKKSRIHPKMKPFIVGERNKIHIIDLEKTKEKLIDALEFIEELFAERKTLLLVGTKIQVRNLVETVARECDLPYVSERWLGGTLTNFQNIQKRVQYFRNLKSKQVSGELQKYTKKERLKIDKEIENLRSKFEGIEKLENVPDAVLVVDMKKNEIAVQEAKKKTIKVIGIVNTNVSPDLADFPIPANNDSISSIAYILEKVKEVILQTEAKKPDVSS